MENTHLLKGRFEKFSFKVAIRGLKNIRISVCMYTWMAKMNENDGLEKR